MDAANTPVREIELMAREYLAEIAMGVIHERMEGNPLEEIERRIQQNIAEAERGRASLELLTVRFSRVRDRIRRKGEGENFLGDVVQKKIDQMHMNRLQLQLMIAKMQVARELLARHRYVEDVLVLDADATEPRRLLR